MTVVQLLRWAVVRRLLARGNLRLAQDEVVLRPAPAGTMLLTLVGALEDEMASYHLAGGRFRLGAT